MSTVENEVEETVLIKYSGLFEKHNAILSLMKCEFGCDVSNLGIKFSTPTYCSVTYKNAIFMFQFVR